MEVSKIEHGCMERQDVYDATNNACKEKIGKTRCNSMSEDHFRLVDTIFGEAEPSQLHILYGSCTLDTGRKTGGLEYLALQIEKNACFATDDFIEGQSIGVEHVFRLAYSGIQVLAQEACTGTSTKVRN